MNIADDDRVSAVALVVEEQEAAALPEGEPVAEHELPLDGEVDSVTVTTSEREPTPLPKPTEPGPPQPDWPVCFNPRTRERRWS